MIVVTHETDFARDVGDRVLFMDGGVIVEEGIPDIMLSNPREERTRIFLSRLLGRSATNVAGSTGLPFPESRQPISAQERR
jgi:polar amino acid transport system ATP-binding protein